MQPVTAMRAGRSLLAVTSILTIALAIAAGAVDPAGSSAARARPQARGADACGASAVLSLSDRRPRQMRPVAFRASSTVPAASVVFYDFSYGDGSDDASAQPTAVHAYQDAGTYLAKVSLVTTCNTIVSSAEYRVVVIDGQPPTVTIGFPRANQVAHFGPAGLLLTGSVSDPSGVRRVEMAIQLLNLKRSVGRPGAGPAGAAAAHPHKPPAGPACYWYDGHVTLRSRACATPLFFAVPVSGGHWSFRMNPRSQIPPGVYSVRVRATDRRGNRTTVFSQQLGDILAFGLVA